MRCPFCRNDDSRVVDSREADEGQAIRRRRSCTACGKRFTTVEEAVLAVVKRSGVTEPFSRDKVVRGVARACQGRPVDQDAVALLAHKVEETVRASGTAEVPSHEVGMAILGPLRELDAVAYLRFASVYRNFSSVADFEAEIADLRGRMSAEDDGGSGENGENGTDERSGGEDAVGGDRSGTSMPGRGEASPAHASTRG
ncbi:transcriptional regulator NrdR [Actinomycetospora endophytica]|uniref:Transcriptional repressor NrdR n=1 Tax=Actinomycetospora endophytica TaxID=2291215 RepID=A0ABS8PG66_9PSEU|nr:transcriptional regulator NrdR [Actinomycetospora endophytica]MCD2197267.1 transcriptional regulator NrdR [Actinomycetospora endophytica]